MRNGDSGTMFRGQHRAPLAWRVLGFTADATGRTIRLCVGGWAAECGHNHPTQAEAEACPWEPAAPPALYAGRVCEVRADHRQVQGAMPW
jgi:hypothetical protein